MHIINNYHIDADENCFILYEFSGKTDKHGKPIKQNMRYYTDLEHLLNALLKINSRKKIQEVDSLSELVAEQKRFSAEIRKLFAETQLKDVSRK